MGRYAEMLFVAECMKRGIDIYVPPQPLPDVDCVVNAGNGFLRVQVKCRRPKFKDGRKRYEACTTNGGRFSSFEVLALLCYDTGEWRFFAAKDCLGKTAMTWTPGSTRDSRSPTAHTWEVLQTITPATPSELQAIEESRLAEFEEKTSRRAEKAKLMPVENVVI